MNNHKPTVWMLWGRKAERHLEGKTLSKDHLKLVAPHPSPFSAYSGFFGCKHFSQANDFLLNHNIEPIIW
jgi:uracil-DNA glycosylase